MSSASEIYQKLLPSLQWSERKELSTHCPLHNDEHPSLSINTTNGRWFCHACNKGGAPVNLFMEMKGTDFKTARRILGLKAKSDKKKITATYNYVDESGKLLYQVIRFEPKTFRQRRPDGNGGYIWNIDGVRLVPKNLPNLLKAETVFIVEGEQDCETLEWMGIVATCNSGGSGKWRFEYNEYFKGKNVVILPDSDDPGRKHAQDVARNLSEIAKSIKVVELPGLPEKGDVTDWVKSEGNDNKKLFSIVNGTQEYIPSESESLHPSDNRKLSENLTDLGNARRFVTQHKDDVRYVPSWGWMCWNGKFWEHDSSGAIVRLAKTTVMSLYAEVLQVEDYEIRQELSKHATKSESQRFISAMIELAKTESEVIATTHDFDRDPLLFNVMNGTIDLRTGLLREHSAADHITKMASVMFDADAKCPLWEKFLHTIMGRNKTLIRYQQKSTGYAMTGSTKEQKVFVHNGGGGNGKSVFINTIRNFFGPYALQAQAETFMTKNNPVIPNDLARLVGARLVTVQETESGKRLAESLVKAVSGGDTITARFLHKEYFEFIPSFKLFLITNHRPIIRGQDYAIWRRVDLIPYSVTIPLSEQDRELEDKLKKELSGILNWTIEGCLAWQREGLGLPEEVQSATSDYRSEQADTVYHFIVDTCKQDINGRISAKIFYEAYQKWCTDNSEDPAEQRIFKRKVQDLGFKQKKTGKNGSREWHGLRFTDGTDDLTQKSPIFLYSSSYEKNIENDVTPSVASVDGMEPPILDGEA